jgi:hypothetical protein
MFVGGKNALCNNRGRERIEQKNKCKLDAGATAATWRLVDLLPK